MAHPLFYGPTTEQCLPMSKYLHNDFDDKCLCLVNIDLEDTLSQSNILLAFIRSLPSVLFISLHCATVVGNTNM